MIKINIINGIAFIKNGQSTKRGIDVVEESKRGKFTRDDNSMKRFTDDFQATRSFVNAWSENRVCNSSVEQYFCGRPILPYEIAQWQQAKRSNYRDNRMTNSNARPWLRISAFQPVTTLFPAILPSLSQNEINFFSPTFEIFLWSTTKRAHSLCTIYIYISDRYPISWNSRW